jgi:hypothetical protein
MEDKKSSITTERLRTQKAIRSSHKEVLELYCGKRQLESWTVNSDHGQEGESESAGQGVDSGQASLGAMRQ